MNEVAAVVRHIRACLPDLQGTALGPEYYYASLPLCVVDAVYSIGVRHNPTIPRTVENWCLLQQPPWQVYRTGGGHGSSIEEFVALLEGRNFEELATDSFKNRQRTSTSSGILKAEAVYRFANVLRDLKINFLGDTDDTARNERAREAIARIPGQRSGISFSYFLMLAGSDSFVKADRMLCRFVADAIQALKPVSPDTAQTLVLAACSALNPELPTLTPRLLDYAIWIYQREVRRPKQPRSA